MKAKGFTVAALVALSVPLHAMAGGERLPANGEPIVQEERGFVVAPVPGRIGPVVVDGCPGLVHWTAYWAARVPVAARFSVSDASWARPFILTPDHPAANLDITFASGTGGETTFDSLELGGERGVVPTGANEAFVCLAHGAPTSFLYRAYEPAEPDPADKPIVQEERGLVVAPVAGRIGRVQVDRCPGLVHVSVHWAARASVAHNFSVSASSWGGQFFLTPDRSLANLDITFARRTGGWITFDSSKLEGERGVVPTGAHEAFVCLAHGMPTDFLYRAYEPAKPRRGES